MKLLTNVGGLRLECARVLDERWQVPDLMYGKKSVVWKEKAGPRIKGLQDG